MQMTFLGGSFEGSDGGKTSVGVADETGLQAAIKEVGKGENVATAQLVNGANVPLLDVVGRRREALGKPVVF